MEPSKKRKGEDNGVIYITPTPTTNTTPTTTDTTTTPPPNLSPQDARKIIEPFSKDQLLDVLQTVVLRDVAVLDAVRSIADSDPTQRKLFIRGIGWETTTEKLRSVFSVYGELDEAVVITDKTTGKSKGYGFVTFKHIDGAILALKEPSKKIDGRITVAQLAAARDSGSVDVSMRKIYVGNVPFEISSERLLSHFSSYGEIEEGPLGFDKQSGKTKGFAFFVYKTEEGARNSLVDPIKNIDGNQVMCKMATDGKKAKPGAPQGPTGMPGMVGDGGVPPPMPTGYGGVPSYGGYTGGRPMPHQNPPMNSAVPSAVGAGGGPGYGNQGPPPSFGGGSGGGYGGGGYNSGGYSSGSHYGGGAASGDYPGVNSYGSSMSRMPPSSGGGYPDGGNYGLSSAYPTPMHQPPPPGPRGPPGPMYHGGPPYY